MMLNNFSCAHWLSVCLLLRNVYLGLLPIFWLVAFLLLNFMSYLYILEIRPLSVTSFETIFSHSVSCLSVFFFVSSAVQKLVSLIRSHWFIFVFISVALGDWPEKTFVRLMSENVLPVFPSGCLVLHINI